MSGEKDIVEHFERYIGERMAMRGLHPNEIHVLHAGHEREVMLTVDDLRDAIAEIKRLREALAECADDLAEAVDAAFSSEARSYPTNALRYEEALAPVIRARELLASTRGE